MSAGVDVLAVLADVQNAAGDYDGEVLQGIAAGDVFDETRRAVAELIESGPGALSHLTGDAKRWYGLQNVANKSRAALLREEADFIESGERAIARFRAALARCQP